MSTVDRCNFGMFAMTFLEFNQHGCCSAVEITGAEIPKGIIAPREDFEIVC